MGRDVSFCPAITVRCFSAVSYARYFIGQVSNTSYSNNRDAFSGTVTVIFSGAYPRFRRSILLYPAIFLVSFVRICPLDVKQSMLRYTTA